MSYDDFESSRKRGQPVELFLIRYGSAPEAFYAFTNAEAPITLDTIVYHPEPVDREKFEVNGRLEDKELTLSVATDHPVAILLTGYPPSWVISITIRQGHVPDPSTPSSWLLGENFPVAWVGRVLSRGGGKGSSVDLVCGPSGHSMNRPGLRRNYQWSCPHVLYGSRCKADKSAATTTETVLSSTGNRLTLDPGWGLAGAQAKYVGGLVEWAGPHATEYRMVLRVTGDELVLSGPTNLPADSEVSLVLGCGHDLTDCEELHDNIVNYGGQAWIPDNNPIHKNNHD